MIVTYNKDNCTAASLYDINGKLIAPIQLPSIGTASFSGRRTQKECFYSFTSYTVPSTIYRFDPTTGKSKLRSANPP